MAAATDTQSSPTRSPVELVRRALALVDQRDVEGMSALWADDVVVEFLAVGVFRGKAAARAYFAEVFAATPDLRTEVQRIAGEGDTVFVQWRTTGTFTGAAFQGIEPTGRAIDLRGMDCFTVRDGKIAANLVAYDGATFARQIGMLPPQGSGADRAVTSAFNATTRLRRRLKSSGS